MQPLSSTHRRAVLLGLFLGPVACGRAPQAALPGGDVRLLVSNGLRLPLESVRAEAQRVLGRPLAIRYGSSRALMAQVEAGEPFEVMIATPEVLEELAAKGFIVAGSRADLARVPVAVGQRGDAPPKDVRTPEALRTALLGARTVRYLDIGASRPTVDKTFAALGVAEALKPKTGTLLGGAAPPPVPPGEYELIINLASEFPPTPGVVYLGPIPEALQVPVWMSAGLGAKGDAAAAKAVVAFLQGPAIEPALAANRMSR